MKARFFSAGQVTQRRLVLGSSVILLSILAAAGVMKGQASSTRALASTTGASSAGGMNPASGDNCTNATVINPALLPFAEDSTLLNNANDIDPGVGGCAPGGGNDVVYSFTPAATDTYVIGATPAQNFDLSLYIVTDCSNPAGTCIAGANANGFDRGESIALTLNAGTRYFIVVDTPILDNNAAGFHFSLRRGRPANDTCATATVIDTSRLPFSFSGSTFGAANDLDPGQTCFTSAQSGRGPDVVFQFTPGDSQLYNITVTPRGDYDTSVFVTTDCSTIANCLGSDVGDAGTPETLLANLTAGINYFIVIDGFGGDAGDFTFTLTPSIIRAPAPPSDLTATAVSPTQINLAWRDNSGDEQGFRLERSLDGFNFNEIATVGSNVTAFNDTNAVPDTIFFYRVFAFNNFGSSAPSNVAFAQTPPSPIPVNPVIVVDPTSIDFGSVRVTQSDTKTVTITNAGLSNLIVSAISDPGGPFTIVNKPALPVTIPSTQSVTFSVRFAPVFIGRVNADFTIQSNDPNAPFTAVALTGVGAGAPVPNLDINPDFIDFGTTPKSVTVDIKNTGEADLLIASLIQPAAPFAVTGSATGTLKAGEKKVLTVTFAPSSLGVFTSGIGVVSNDPDTFLTFITLKGTSLVQAGPRVVGLEFRKRSLRFQSASSNVTAGAVLIVDNKETFPLELSGELWIVTKGARSTPGNLRVRDIFVSPSTHTVIVRNPDGGISAPVTITV